MAQSTRGEPVELGGFIVARLGEGGMGRVHLARSASGRLAAVKTVHEHLAVEAEFRERFRRETVAARAVAGPFTAAVLDADPDAERPWLATEFCAGPDLTAAVAAHGPLGPAELATLGAALAEALSGVHAVGLTHRDLKPSNILITRDGPKVLDFGIAKSAADESLTAADEAIGSPGFIAPEQLARDGEPGPAADVFALGAVLALAATGRAPFGTGGAPAVLYRTLHDEPDLEGVRAPPGPRFWPAAWRVTAPLALPHRRARRELAVAARRRARPRHRRRRPAALDEREDPAGHRPQQWQGPVARDVRRDRAGPPGRRGRHRLRRRGRCLQGAGPERRHGA